MSNFKNLDKINCFAYTKDGNCNVLTTKDCYRCKFYLTKEEQLEKETNAKKYLIKKYGISGG